MSSVDGKTWTEVFANKRFDNIVNNPVPQEVIISKPIEAKALRLIPVETREDDGYASREFTAVL